MTVSKNKQPAANSVGRPVTSGSGNELSLIQQGNNLLYDARLLHRDLQIKTRLNDWIQRRIEEYGFEEGVDFFVTQTRVAKTKRNDYLLTIDMCKELGMLERSAIGRAIRKRFIEEEKRARGLALLPRHAELFRGLKPQVINGQKLYNYKSILERAGYSLKTGGSRRARYPQHFVLVGKELFITEAFALHLHHQRQVLNNRLVLLQAQPVLPLNFGDGRSLQAFNPKNGGAQ